MLVCNLTERLLSLGCIDAGESDDVLDVFSVQNVDRASGSRAWGRAAALWRRDPGSGCR
jgi:hypothetical protein